MPPPPTTSVDHALRRRRRRTTALRYALAGWAAASAVLLVVVLVAWAGSHHWELFIGRAIGADSPRPMSINLALSRGRLYVTTTEFPRSGPDWPVWRPHFKYRRLEPGPPPGSWSRRPTMLFLGFGFMLERLRRDENGLGPHWIVVVPLYAVAGVAAAATVPPVFLLRRSRRRDAAGLCTSCGYDLRGTPGGRCPECGATAALSAEAGVTRHVVPAAS